MIISLYSHGPEKTYKDKIEFLKRPSSYTDPTREIQIIETHMSMVFLTKNFAYKLKKPIDYDFLNFKTIESRKQSALRELELNQLLAPNIYLKVVALSLDKNGNIYLDENKLSPYIIDWLVKMKRLPHSQFMDNAIKNNEVNLNKVKKAAHALGQFYLKNNKKDLIYGEYKNLLKNRVLENHQSLMAKKYNLDKYIIENLYHYQKSFIKTHKDALIERVKNQYIVDGHGDLRPEHICLTNPPVIIDRLEIDSNMRTIDPLDELSFLAIECELLGRVDIGRLFFSTYSEVTNDKWDPDFITFYKVYRCLLRAKISLWHLDDKEVKNKQKWKNKANNYINLANTIYMATSP